MWWPCQWGWFSSVPCSLGGGSPTRAEGPALQRVPSRHPRGSLGWGLGAQPGPRAGLVGSLTAWRLGPTEIQGDRAQLPSPWGPKLP